MLHYQLKTFFSFLRLRLYLIIKNTILRYTSICYYLILKVLIFMDFCYKFNLNQSRTFLGGSWKTYSSRLRNAIQVAAAFIKPQHTTIRDGVQGRNVRLTEMRNKATYAPPHTKLVRISTTVKLHVQRKM